MTFLPLFFSCFSHFYSMLPVLPPLCKNLLLPAQYNDLFTSLFSCFSPYYSVLSVLPLFRAQRQFCPSKLDYGVLCEQCLDSFTLITLQCPFSLSLSLPIVHFRFFFLFLAPSLSPLFIFFFFTFSFLCFFPLLFMLIFVLMQICFWFFYLVESLFALNFFSFLICVL